MTATTKTGPTPEAIARVLKLLGEGTMPCPFCETMSEHLFPYEDGPRLELYEGSVDDAIVDLYRPTPVLPVCPSCESDFDVVAEPPPRHFKLTAKFTAAARCDGCGEELGDVTYEAFDIKDEGLHGD